MRKKMNTGQMISYLREVHPKNRIEIFPKEDEPGWVQIIVWDDETTKESTGQALIVDMAETPDCWKTQKEKFSK